VIVANPAVTPVTTPLVLPTVAVDVLLLIQVPPVSVLLRVIERPKHTADGPLIAAGTGLTETVVVV
jgi:hypothetical protein